MVTRKKRKRRLRIGYHKLLLTRRRFEELARTQLYPDDFDDVVTAYTLAEMGHKGELRHDKAQYFEHCKSVAFIIMLELKVFLPGPIIGGLLHDFKELDDSKKKREEDESRLSWRALYKQFSKSVYRGLRIITKEREKDYYWGIENVAPRDWWIMVVKFADRLHNLRNIFHEPKRFTMRQLEETEEIYPHLLEVFSKKVPRHYRYLIEYIREEFEFACNKIRKRYNLPRSIVFKRVEP